MSERAEPLVSVVTPFYNTAAYLAECIESVIRQTYHHWEYVLVDNQSTDGSSDLALSYAARDPRIRVVRNPAFLTQVQNYNRALEQIAPGSVYTKMVEADNWIYPDSLAQMVALAEGHPRVGLVGSYGMSERTVRFLGLPQATGVLSGRELVRMQYLDDAYLFGAPTTVLMRSDAVRSRRPFYDESTWLVEDLSACYELLRTWDFGFVHQILTFVRTDNESILSGRRAFDPMALDRLAALTRHGRDFLSAEEYAWVYRRTRDHYYDRLAAGALQRQGAAYWKYHRDGLAELGLQLERGRLWTHVAAEVARMVANPGRSLKALVRSLGAQS
jgi:glycosyltransferase involved in cell wall biosynthesis